MTGGRHARRAALPPGEFARDRQPGPGSLAVTVAGESGGTEAVFDFSVLPGPPALLAACAAGFARMAGPDQPWRAAATCVNGYKAIREFLRWAAALDPPPQAPDEITPAVQAQWRLSRPGTVYGRACQLAVRQWLPQVPGIPAATIAASARRIPAGPAPSEAAYTREEFGQIKAAAACTFGTALVRIRAGQEQLLRWRAGEFPRPRLREQYRQTQPETAGYLTGEALDVLQRTGDVPLTRAGHRTVTARHARALGGAGPRHTWARLFLTLPEAAALAVLLVCDQGWNRSVLDVMTVPDDMPGVGEDGLDIYRAEIVKRRRPARARYSSANLPDTGPGSPGRLIRQAIGATQPARTALASLGTPTDRLLVSRRDQFRGRQDMFCLGAPPGDSMRRWAAGAGLAGPDGEPLQVSLRRLRRTVQVLIRRKQAQNSRQTHESAYVLRDPAALPEAEQVTVQGLTNAVSHARATVKMRMLLDTGPGQPAAGTGGLEQALADGTLDTVAGACLDFTNSPSGPPGQPCTASFLDCLACGNAVATRRHLPRLAWLHRALDELRATAPPATWERDWQAHFLRLTTLLEDNTTAAERQAAAIAASDTDRADRRAAQRTVPHMTVTALTLPGVGDRAWHVPAGAPFADPDRLPDGTSPADLSRYGDAAWDLSPLSRRQHEPARQVNWDLFPVALRASFKRAGWALVNLPTPEALLERAATCRARQPSTGTIASTVEHWRRYAAWLVGRGITRLADVDAACHGEWAAHVARLPVAVRTRGLALNAVSVLWGMAPHLPAADRVPMPPWEAEGLRYYLPPDEGRSENGTAPVDPAVMSPLLTWALRFTEDFAADILAALAEHERLRSRIAARHNPEAASRLAALLDEHARAGIPLPGETVKGRACAAVSYLAEKTGASITQAGNALRRARLPVGSTVPLGTPVTVQLRGKPWTRPISYHQAPALALRLSAACLIVVAYLSGLRPAEILHLQSGSCPAPADDGTGPVRYRLHGVKFKAARNDEGTPAPDGEARQWTVIPPVHTAISILEQLTATSHLFPFRPHWLNGAPSPPRRPEPSTGGSRGRRRRTGQVITTGAANTRIAEFVTWVNAYAREHGLDNETIPDDPDGPVTLSRFRRTIAWHIARLPGGTVALAIQYGHLRTLTSEGYSGRSRHGLRDLLDLETARAMASYLQEVSDSLDSGGGVSGPAARRLADAARRAASRFEGLFLSPRQARALLADPALQVHDSPEAFLACNYDPAKALCHPDREVGSTAGHPALDRCDPACANIARTDEHITALAAEIARLRAESASPLLPGPIRQRLAGRAAALEKIAERHARTRITPGDDNARR